MKKEMNALFAEKIQGFRLPRYCELPNMGLYLEQVTKYINGFLIPLDLPEITSSMVSNYVKKGVIAAPVKKLYYAEQIAYLIFIGFAKSVLSLENIAQLFVMQQKTYECSMAYDYFCSKFESMLLFVAGLSETVENIGVTSSDEKDMLRSVIIAVTHVIFVNNCFDTLKQNHKG